MKDPRVKVALLSIACNAALVLLKLLGANLSLSMAMKADAIHSLSDVFVSALVLYGVLLSQKHKRWLNTVENVIALIISLFIFSAAAGILVEALRPRGEGLTRLPAAIGIVWACILISYAISQYKVRHGRACKSPSIEADGYHSLMDMYSSVIVLIGLVGHLIGIGLDTAASIIVALLIFKVGLETMVASIEGLTSSELFSVRTIGEFFRDSRLGRALSGAQERLVELIPLQAVPMLERTGRAVYRHRRAAVVFVIALGLVAYAATGLFRIQPDELGVVLVCGKLEHDNLTPGLHYRPPSPLSRLYRVKAGRLRQLEFGFRTVARREDVQEPTAYLWESRHTTGIYEKREAEAVMLTGDKNEADVNITIEYRVAERAAAKYLFRLADVEAVVRAATESCTRHIVGTMRLSEVLTTARQELEHRLGRELQALLDSYDAGVAVSAVRLQDVHPPVAVVPAFRQVATARENKVTVVNQATAYQKATIPKARGAAQYILADADAYRAEKELHATGDATYFNAVAEVAKHFPDAMPFIMYMEAVDAALPPLRKVILSRALSAGAGGAPLETYFLTTEFLKMFESVAEREEE